jgi:microcystin-dependent protein
MAETRTTRFAIPQWSAGTDSGSRADFNEAFLQVETLGALYKQGTLAARPAAAAANQGMFYMINGDTALLNGLLWYSNGATWILVGQYMRDMTVQASVAGNVALIVKAFTSGTADLQQWQNTTGTTVLRVDNTGKVIAPTIQVTGAAQFVGAQFTGDIDVDGSITGDYKSLSNRADGTPKMQVLEDGSGRFDGLIPPKMMMFCPTLPIPAGWLECDGSAVSRTTYVDLWAALGNPNTGDGSTTFNLPDMRDRVPMGRSVSKAIGTTGGASSINLTVGQLPSHSHTINHTHGAGTTSTDSHNHSFGFQAESSGVNTGSRPVVRDIGNRTAGGGTGYTMVTSTDSHAHTFQTPTFTGSSGTIGNGDPVNITPSYFAGVWVIKS